MKISVITVVYNDKEGLRRTMDSVFMQVHDSIEYIVIDGNSTDGTAELMEENRARLFYCVSERDSGIYDAMNKGIKQATGEYLLFLNAGDCFLSDRSVTSLAEGAGESDLIYGNIKYRSATNEFTDVLPDRLNFAFFVDKTLPHPCTLIRRTWFTLYGLYNTGLPICADWAFFLDLVIKQSAKYQHVNTTIAVFEYGGVSSHFDNVKREKDGYLKQYYEFYLDGYRVSKRYESRLSILRHFFTGSIVLRLLLKVWPGEIKEALFRKNEDV